MGAESKTPDLSKLTLDQLYAERAKLEPPKPSYDFSGLSDDQLIQERDALMHTPTIGDKALSAGGAIVSTVGRTIDRFGGAPTRAAISELTSSAPRIGQNPEDSQILGNIKAAGSAFANQFGRDPDLAPGMKQVAINNFGISDIKGKPIPFYKFASELTPIDKKQIERQGLKPDSHGRYQLGTQENASPADAVGIVGDIVADPLNAFAFGAPEFFKGLASGAKSLNRSAFGIKLEKNAAEIIKIAEEAGVKPTAGQLIDSPFVKQQENMLSQSHGFVGGTSLRAQIKENQAILEKAAEDLSAGAGIQTKQEAGQTFTKQFKQSLEDKIRPAEQTYNLWEDALRKTGLPVSTEKLSAKFDEFAKVEAKFSPEAKAAIDGIQVNLKQLQTIDDIKRYRSTVGNILESGNLDGNVKRVYSALYGDLTSLRSDSLKALATQDQTAEFAQEAIKQLKDADTLYRSAAEQTTNALLGNKKSKLGPKATAKQFFEKNSASQAATKVLDLKNPARIEQFSKDFPEAFNTLKSRKIGELVDASQEAGKLNPKKFAKNLDKLPEESINLLFGEGADKKIDAIKQFYATVPEQVNPSRSAITALLTNAWTWPTSQGMSVLRRTAYRALTNPELGKDVFTRIGNSALTVPIVRTGIALPKLNKKQDNGISLPRGK